jgi:DNA-binding GntR family transcriptional regulator
VREAILRLNREGLVDVFPRSGTQVRRFTERDIEEIFELRTALETLAIRKAVPRLSPAMLARLTELYEHAEAAIKVGDPKPALDFDTEMHRAVLQACDNHRLQQSMATINDFVILFRNIGAGTPFHRGFTYRHREIVSALERRDPDLAARMLAEHIDAAKTEVFRDFRQRKLLDPVAGTAANVKRRVKRLADAPATGTNKPD